MLSSDKPNDPGDGPRPAARSSEEQTRNDCNFRLLDLLGRKPSLGNLGKPRLSPPWVRVSPIVALDPPLLPPPVARIVQPLAENTEVVTELGSSH